VSVLLLLLGTGGVLVASVLFASCLRLETLVAFVVVTYLFATAEIVVVSLALSLGDWLTRAMLLVAIAVVLGSAVVAWSWVGRPRPPVPVNLRAKLAAILGGPVLATLTALVTVVYGYVLFVALTVPQSAVDALIYHLPRSAFWRQQHAVAYVASSPEEPINAHPPNAEIETAATMILSGGDRYVALVQLVAVAVTSVGIYGIARRLNFDRRAAAFGATLYPTFTLVVLQAPTALNDLVLAALLVCAAFFVAGPATRLELALFALALALALGTKLSTFFAVPILAVLALASQPRRRWPGVGIAGVCGLAAGSYWYAVNRAETGKFDGGLAAAFPQGGDGTVVGTPDVMRRLAAYLL
jgi:hypothetical protein